MKVVHHSPNFCPDCGESVENTELSIEDVPESQPGRYPVPLNEDITREAPEISPHEVTKLLPCGHPYKFEKI